jgi:hypothetical protein
MTFHLEMFLIIAKKANIKRIKYFFSQIQQLLFGLMLTTTKEQE